MPGRWPPRSPALLVADPDPDRPAVLHEDLLDGVVEQAGPTTRLDDGARPLGDRARGADRVPGALEVVRHDQRVHREGAARGRQAVVAPLRRHHGAQPGVAEPPLEVVLGGGEGEPTVAQTGEAHTRPQHHRRRPAVGLAAVPGRRAPHVVEVALDGRCLVRELRHERGGVLGGVARHLEGEVGVVEHLDDVRHLLPLHRAASHEVEQPTKRAALGQPAEVVNPDVPVKTPALERVRETTELEVRLEHQYALALEPRQQAARGEPTHSRTHDDDVVVVRFVHGVLRSAVPALVILNEARQPPTGARRTGRPRSARPPEPGAERARRPHDRRHEARSRGLVDGGLRVRDRHTRHRVVVVVEHGHGHHPSPGVTRPSSTAWPRWRTPRSCEGELGARWARGRRATRARPGRGRGRAPAPRAALPASPARMP